MSRVQPCMAGAPARQAQPAAVPARTMVIVIAAGLLAAATLAQGSLRTVTIQVAAPAATRDTSESCTKDSRSSAYLCPSLPAALDVAATLDSAASTVLFAGAVETRVGLHLRSAPAPATLRLRGTGGAAAIDGAGVSALLKISGSGAVSVQDIAFRQGAVAYHKGTKDYAPINVGFPEPLKLPTTFTNCTFTNMVGAYGGAVALHHGETAFEGCTFSGCSSFGDGGSDVPHQHGGGGAIYNIGGSLILRRSRFINCSCSDPPGVAPGTTGGHNGGAVLSMRGKVVADECDFIGGKAGQAGAVYLFLYASLTSRNSRFIDNHARCIGNHSSSVAVLLSHNDCTWASGTGGAVFMDRGAATLINATFTRNTADLAGGALYAWNANKDNNITLLGGMFSQNEARTQWGGAISNWHSHVILNGTSFADNQAAMMGGAVWTDAESLTNLTTCTWHQKLARALPPPQLLRPVPPQQGETGTLAWSHPHGTTILAAHNILEVPTMAEGSHTAIERDFTQCTIEDSGLDVHVQNTTSTTTDAPPLTPPSPPRYMGGLSAAVYGNTDPSVPLHNAAAPGMTMSASGLGTGGPGCYNESSDQLASLNSSLSWLRLGGRRFDGAISYACDRGIGLAIKESGVPRHEVFVTSKIGPGGVPFPLGFNETMTQAKRILSDISSDYVDLLLVHEPFSFWPNPEAAQRAPSTDPACNLSSPSTYSERGCRLSTWRALVALWKAGVARSIGVSNWNSTHILELEAVGLPLPAVNQVEFSPLHQGNGGGGCNCGHSASRSTPLCGESPAENAETCAALMIFMRDKHIVFNSYSPFGGGGDETGKLLSDPRLQRIGSAHNASVAQVILNWQWSKGIVVNPQATRQEYQTEDLHFEGFELSASEMHVLDTFDRAVPIKLDDDDSALAGCNISGSWC